jgi:hypothetical protein
MQDMVFPVRDMTVDIMATIPVVQAEAEQAEQVVPVPELAEVMVEPVNGL